MNFWNHPDACCSAFLAESLLAHSLALFIKLPLEFLTLLMVFETLLTYDLLDEIGEFWNVTSELTILFCCDFVV